MRVRGKVRKLAGEKSVKKQIVVIFLLLFLCSSYSYAELSKQDLQEIRQLIREEIKVELTGINGEIAKLNLRIDELEKRVNTQFASVDAKIAALDAKIEAVDSKVGTVQWTLNILIVIIVAILALPQAVSFIRERRESQELAFLRQQILELQKKMESKG